MKLGAFIKQSLLYLLVMLFVGSAWRVLSPYYIKIIEELGLKLGSALMGIAILYYVWYINAIYGKYALLKYNSKDNSIFFWSMLLVFNALLAWLMAWSGVTELFVRALLKSQSLPYYGLVFQWILLGIVGGLILMPYATSIISGQRLLIIMGYRSYKKMMVN